MAQKYSQEFYAGALLAVGQLTSGDEQHAIDLIIRIIFDQNHLHHLFKSVPTIPHTSNNHHLHHLQPMKGNGDGDSVGVVVEGVRELCGDEGMRERLAASVVGITIAKFFVQELLSEQKGMRECECDHRCE